MTFWEFEHFSLLTGYHDRRGNEPDSLTIDRYDADEGYTVTNIAILPRAENSRKWWEIDRPRRMAAPNEAMATLNRAREEALAAVKGRP